MLGDLVQIDHSPKLLYFIQDLVKLWLLSHSFAALSIDNLNEYITSVYITTVSSLLGAQMNLYQSLRIGLLQSSVLGIFFLLRILLELSTPSNSSDLKMHQHPPLLLWGHWYACNHLFFSQKKFCFFAVFYKNFCNFNTCTFMSTTSEIIAPFQPIPLVFWSIRLFFCPLH